MGDRIDIALSAHRFNRDAFVYYAPLTAVQRYVQEHISKPICLAEAARAAGFEKKYFSAFFHSKVCMPFSEWIRVLRVTRAAQYMQEHDESILRVAFAAGFRDVRTFERVFKRYVGVTPSSYRASVRPESRWMPQ